MTLRGIVTLLCFVGLTGALGAQPAQPTFPVNDTGAGAFRVAANGVFGTARNADNSPMPGVTLVLRNLRSGVIAQRVVTNELGAFAVRGIEPGTYVVELVSPEGTVVALSEAVTVGTGEIVQTLVRVVGRTRTFAWWAGSSTATALNSAANLGVLAFDAGEAVSPPGGTIR